MLDNVCPLIFDSLIFSAWLAFTLTEEGEPDTTIDVYQPRPYNTPPDFKPVDIDVFLAERILSQAQIDPKLIYGER